MEYSVYVIFDGSCRKVGYSYSPLNRLKDLQIGNPRKLVLEYTSTPANNRATARLIEQSAHMRMSSQHVVGEWYSVGREEAIRAIELGPIVESNYPLPVVSRVVTTSCSVQTVLGGTPFTSVADRIIKSNPKLFK